MFTYHETGFSVFSKFSSLSLKDNQKPQSKVKLSKEVDRSRRRLDGSLSCSFYLIRGAGPQSRPQGGKKKEAESEPEEGVLIFPNQRQNNSLLFTLTNKTHIKYNTYASAISSSITRWSLRSRWTL